MLYYTFAGKISVEGGDYGRKVPGKRKHCTFSTYISFRRGAERRFSGTFTIYLYVYLYDVQPFLRPSPPGYAPALNSPHGCCIQGNLLRVLFYASETFTLFRRNFRQLYSFHVQCQKKYSSLPGMTGSPTWISYIKRWAPGYSSDTLKNCCSG